MRQQPCNAGSRGLRWLLCAVFAGHGLLHLLGVAKGFGWSEVAQLAEPIGPAVGVLWLVAAALVLASAVLLAVGTPRWWWPLTTSAAVVSQAAIATSWDDALAGTIVNVVLLLTAGYGLATDGPTSFDALYRRRVAKALAELEPTASLVSESDLADLPRPLAA